MAYTPLWKPPPGPDPVVHEVPVDAELLDRVLKVVTAYILPNDAATEADYHFVKKIQIRLLEGGAMVLVPLPSMEALLFVADHTARLLELGKKPEQAAAMRADRDELERLKTEYIARLCENCRGTGSARAQAPVEVEGRPGQLYFPQVTCPVCEGTGLVPRAMSSPRA